MISSTISFNQPAAPPSDAAVATAIGLLVAMTDAKGTRARLDETLAQIAALQAAHAEAVAARDAAVAEQKKVGDLVAREAKLAADQAELEQGRTQANVAASALAAREAKITAAEAAMAKARDEIAAREKALAAKLASYRQALA
jgi:hypothetical protein